MSMIILESVGMIETNCYLVQIEDGHRLYIIDPGSEPDNIIKAAATLNFDEAVILLTHAHVDHIGGIRGVMDALKVSTVYLHPLDLGLYNSPDNHLMPFIPRAKNLPVPVSTMAGTDFTILETPGHTPGGVCFYFKQLQALFAGDTLFSGSIGRTDLPGGSMDTILDSIRNKILVLPDSVKVYPGHGPATSVGSEKLNNPYLS
jgi:glyoxylase-like metal-dependent hydrolase (beta-lactamase superfamily II)